MKVTSVTSEVPLGPDTKPLLAELTVPEILLPPGLETSPMKELPPQLRTMMQAPHRTKVRRYRVALIHFHHGRLLALPSLGDCNS